MKLLLDENIPLSLASILAQRNFKVLHILDTNLKGASDELIFKFAQKRKFIIVTFDKDFLSDEYFEKNHFGIIFIKSRNKNITKLAEDILDSLKSYRSLKNKIIIIED